KPQPELTSSLKGDVLTGNSVTLTCTLNTQSTGWRFYWNTSTQSTETETNFYNITSVGESSRGGYQCRAGRGNDSVYYTHYSDELQLNVTVSPKPVVNITPDTQVFWEERVTFRCDIQPGGDTVWTYSWYRDNNSVGPDISSVRDSDGGKYTCRGTRRSDSQLSNISDPVTLSVSAKPKPELTSSLTAAALTGNSVTLYCTLTPQSTGWKFYWEKDSQHKTETDTHSYTIRSVNDSDRGGYKCRAGRGGPVYYTQYSDELQLNVT
ncbi:carcinoembryonic antigen-related cell adhesion molecule 5-like, partial [Clarias magur]